MSRTNRIANILAVAIPFAACLIAPIVLWGNGFGWSDLVAFVVMYLITGFGITVGFHRLLTHRSFDAPAPVRAGLAILGSMSVQGAVIHWVEIALRLGAARQFAGGSATVIYLALGSGGVG